MDPVSFLAGTAVGIAGGLALARLLPAARRRLSSPRVRRISRGEQRLQALLDRMVEGVALVDGGGRVVLCNPCFEGFFRVAPGAEFAPAALACENPAPLAKALETSRATGKSAAAEVRLASTPPRDVSVTLTPYGEADAAGGTIITAIDITERRRAELIRTEFVANVSHELRTPLAAIRGYVETLVEEDAAGGSPPYGKFLGIIHQHALRLNALIEDLLILSRIESRTAPLKIGPLALAEPLDTAIATLAESAARKSIAISRAVPPNLPEVLADRSALERILINLIENAIKYSDEKTTVSVLARPEPGALVVTVRDQGVGIPKEHQARIFERFYRVDKARSRATGGTGLGLAIVKNLVESHGGEIWVDSDPGRGAAFSFRLPCRVE